MEYEMNGKVGHGAVRARKAGYPAAFAVLAAAVCLGWQDAGAQVCAEPLASNFTKTELVPSGKTDFPVHIAVVPDGRVFIAEMKSGRIMLYKPGSNTPTVAGTISTRFENEDGMLGIAAPPDFAQSKFLYAFYSDPSSTNRAHVLSRYTVNGDVLDMGSKVEILRIPRVALGMWHAAGGMVFDDKGNLYISTGDDTNPHGAPNDGYGPINTDDAVKDAQKSSSNTNDLRGKVLRIRPQATQVDGKYYTIPAGNFKEAFTSFYSEAELAKIKPEIYAMGMRNPYRVGVDSKTGWIFWGDVGPDAGSDNPNRGRAGHDEFNLATKPGYFGWPYCNGNQFAYNAVDYSGTGSVIGAKYDCANLTNNSPHNTGVNKLPPAQAPLIWYAASNSTDFPAMGNGGAETAVAGPMYRYDANLVSTKKFPPQYDGRVYFWDWSRNQHKLLSFTADGKLDKTVNFPITGLKSHVSAQYGPEGALYMLQYSNAGYTGENITALIRIDYTGPHEPACFPTTKALRGSAAGSSKRLPVLAGFSSVDLPDGAAGFEAYDMQGKKVWTYIKAVGDPGRVNLPEHISGGLLRIRFL